MCAASAYKFLQKYSNEMFSTNGCWKNNPCLSHKNIEVIKINFLTQWKGVCVFFLQNCISDIHVSWTHLDYVEILRQGILVNISLYPLNLGSYDS